jgi:aldose 1-epimerase
VTAQAQRRQDFGQTPDGYAAGLYTLSNDSFRVRVTDFGARIVSLEVPDRTGRVDHVVLGFDDVSEYIFAGGAFGAVLGRNANRIGGAVFTLEGRTYCLSKNEQSATLHGGGQGFDKLFWQVDRAGDGELVLGLVSPDGDQGFPGELSVKAHYKLEGNTLQLSLEATTTKASPVSLSAHPYFNLGGPPFADVLGHEITIAADAFLPTDRQQIPTGEIRAVDGTVFDLRRPTVIGTRIRSPIGRCSSAGVMIIISYWGSLPEISFGLRRSSTTRKTGGRSKC